MIRITDNIEINENEIKQEFIRSSGPGGQNVNKVSTAVQLRFDVRNSPSLPEDIKVRLYKIAGSRITNDGILIIEAKRFRTQESNRQDSVDRFIELIRKAAVKPKARKATKPTAESRKVRVESKRRRGQVKSMRRLPPGGDD